MGVCEIIKCSQCSHRLWLNPRSSNPKTYMLFCSAGECFQSYLNQISDIDERKQDFGGYTRDDAIDLTGDYDVEFLAEFPSYKQLEEYMPTKFCRRQDLGLLNKLRKEYWKNG